MKNNTTKVWVTTQFEGFHRWQMAPENVAFLRDVHRHLFHVRLSVPVQDLDREVEFFTLKAMVDKYIAEKWEGRVFNASCEMIAIDLMEKFAEATMVEVSEDGENGGTVEKPICLVPRNKIFVGVEAEGPYRGEVVLFVPGSVGSSRLQKVVESGILEKYRIDRIYYGAGNDRNLNKDTLLYLRDQVRMLTTVEGESLWEGFGDIFSRWDVGLTLVSMDSESIKVHYRKKIENSLIIWQEINGNKVYKTSVWDPLFQGDFSVEK